MTGDMVNVSSIYLIGMISKLLLLLLLLLPASLNPRELLNTKHPADNQKQNSKWRTRFLCLRSFSYYIIVFPQQLDHSQIISIIHVYYYNHLRTQMDG